MSEAGTVQIEHAGQAADEIMHRVPAVGTLALTPESRVSVASGQIAVIFGDGASIAVLRTGEHAPQD